MLNKSRLYSTVIFSVVRVTGRLMMLLFILCRCCRVFR